MDSLRAVKDWEPISKSEPGIFSIEHHGLAKCISLGSGICFCLALFCRAESMEFLGRKRYSFRVNFEL